MIGAQYLLNSTNVDLDYLFIQISVVATFLKWICRTTDIPILAQLFAKPQLCYCDPFKVLVFVISMAILEMSIIIAMNNWKKISKISRHFIQWHSVLLSLNSSAKKKPSDFLVGIWTLRI